MFTPFLTQINAGLARLVSRTIEIHFNVVYYLLTLVARKTTLFLPYQFQFIFLKKLKTFVIKACS
jgi:hypothetical protein